MSIFQVGRMCVKIAGRDAGEKCVIVEQLNDPQLEGKGRFVLVDGATRRKKVNIKHLEPLMDVIDIAEGATHEEVLKAFKELGITVSERKTKIVPARPVKQKMNKKKAAPTVEGKKDDKKQEKQQESAGKADEKKSPKKAKKKE